MSILRLAVASLMLLGTAIPALAQQVSLDGYFIAFADCEANKRLNSDNPGNVRLEKLHAYEMIGRNATPGTHYQVKIPGAPAPESRWVRMECGAFAPKDALVVAGSPVPDPDNEDPVPGGPFPPDSLENQLAASWQPGFCATEAGEDKAECRTQTAARPDARQFSIHGLWPDDLDNKALFPCYCDRGTPVSCRERLPAEASIPISAPVLDALSVVMPGVQSDLHLHEWTKHGTCYEDDRSGPEAGADPDEYYSDTMALLAQLNASPVRQLFVDHLGRDLSREDIEAAFDEAFGAGAGERVVIRCDRDRGVITELWIGLKGAIDENSDLGALIQAAPTTNVSTDQESCAGGPVVEVTAN